MKMAMIGGAAVVMATVSGAAMADDATWAGDLKLAQADMTPYIVPAAEQAPEATANNAAANDVKAQPLDAIDFDKGDWRLYGYASGTLGGGNHIYEGHLGGGYYFFDNLSINLELAAGYTEFNSRGGAPAGDTGNFGFDVLLRYHFLKGKDWRGAKWSLYADGGCGFRYFGPESFPANGTHVNWTPQAGLGATYELKNNWSLMGGARFFHVSNGNIYGGNKNPGYDSLQLYAGLMCKW